MPYVQPSRADVHVNRPLTRISVHFAQSQTKFVADRAFRTVPVEKQSDRYFTFDRGEFNRDEAKKRAPATESAGGTYTIDNTPSYFADVWAFHKDVPDQVRDNADAPLNLDTEATNFCTTKMLIRKEKDWASQFFTSGVWTGAPTVGGGKWNEASGVPIKDVRDAKRAVMKSTGFEPNIGVATRAVYDALLDQATIIDRINRGQTPVGPAIANRQALAAVFELEEILVLDAIENTAKKGAAATHAFITGDEGFLLLYRPPSPGILTPAAGYTFSWTGFTGASGIGSRIKRFRMEEIEADRVEIQAAWDFKLVSADLGSFFADVLT